MKFNRSKYTFQILEVFSPLLLSSQRLLGVFWKFPWWAWGENAPSTYHMTEKERRRYFFPPDSILILDICWSMVFFWMLAFFFPLYYSWHNMMWQTLSFSDNSETIENDGDLVGRLSSEFCMWMMNSPQQNICAVI